jgi:Predicted metal-binding integral membrane protein (DUF2182)
MASFFALGIMSVVWMAIVAGLIAIEKTLPWRRAATYGRAAVLLVLGALLLAVPHAVPGNKIPPNTPMSHMEQISPYHDRSSSGSRCGVFRGSKPGRSRF